MPEYDFSIIASVHTTSLRVLCQHLDMHVAGPSIAARIAGERGLPGDMEKKHVRIDTIAVFARHAIVPGPRYFLVGLTSALDSLSAFEGSEGGGMSRPALQQLLRRHL